MLEPFIGGIVLFAGNFNPRGYAFCQGQLLGIAQNTALFSILGTTYGGNGTTTFALPDLRGRAAIQQGTGPGLSPVVLGEVAGSEFVTILSTQMPVHNHTMTGSTLAGDSSIPTGAVPANSGALDKEYSTVFSSNVAMAATGVAGGNQPIGIRNPYLGLNYIIALQGIFPTRN